MVRMGMFITPLRDVNQGFWSHLQGVLDKIQRRLLLANKVFLRVHSKTKTNTVKPRFNEPLFNEVLNITSDILPPGQSCSKMYGIKPQYNETRYNEFFDITNIFWKPKRKIYFDITNYNVNTLNIQHTTADKCCTDQQSGNPYGKVVMVKIKRQQLFSQQLIICHRYLHYRIST